MTKTNNGSTSAAAMEQVTDLPITPPRDTTQNQTQGNSSPSTNSSPLHAENFSSAQPNTPGQQENVQYSSAADSAELTPPITPGTKNKLETAIGDLVENMGRSRLTSGASDNTPNVPFPLSQAQHRNSVTTSSTATSDADSLSSKLTTNLQFKSNFESGNLGRVHQRSEFEFDLYIRPDSNNPNYRLWFYFSVSNVKKNQRVLLNICNFSKTKSLYRNGMTPLVSSKQRPQWENIPERQCFYYRCPRHRRSYVMSFMFVFDRDDDVYYFAYCFPYTYSDLQKFLLHIRSRELSWYKQELLTRTIMRRRLDLLTITNSEVMSEYGRKHVASLNGERGIRKKMIFITARVHPGETPSSFICHGLISFLISDHPNAVLLRDFTIFKVIPMLNPDGVFLGNYRCSSVGNDLNRHWLNPEDWAHPTIVATRNILLQYKNDPTVELDFFIDIHSHSVGTSAFMYVNYIDDSKESQLTFPKLLSVRSPYFSFAQSKICKDAAKLGSGRRALGELLRVANHCYTLEVSFYCWTNSAHRTIPFTEESYTDIGRAMGLTFLDFYKLPSGGSSEKGGSSHAGSNSDSRHSSYGKRSHKKRRNNYS
uniref:Peptidase M14 domain-containing protein n=1 Tax=Percolomonas cosmopolitus TaxID=63605 RepID=A0A7S1KVG6_9EUKA|mmetsp:Transcript_8585/g.31748  ORF Transcript_8585/g.31748 Transcript_8585/m.31748 type:complete len:594 (+) Transcript_8585:184-1965(+)|eukprot:CAMPEP_0117443342 /NCGR_PEP_ID=MMETSP0759-20121206/4646_1 /TAXON_ID=63605 /ORGANISM="Percolomonas cosmopolitus, Strain WS" /LENGTH=593 /DNA_ID=CAMNT_0005235315 /DNA_START=456 /DNA_END=2237 /DNA_ORIENTATION=-